MGIQSDLEVTYFVAMATSESAVGASPINFDTQATDTLVTCLYPTFLVNGLVILYFVLGYIEVVTAT